MIQLSLPSLQANSLSLTSFGSDDGREYRDEYGYYRYVRGAKLYVECVDRFLDPRRDNCRPTSRSTDVSSREKW